MKTFMFILMLLAFASCEKYTTKSEPAYFYNYTRFEVWYDFEHFPTTVTISPFSGYDRDMYFTNTNGYQDCLNGDRCVVYLFEIKPNYQPKPVYYYITTGKRVNYVDTTSMLPYKGRIHWEDI